MKKLIISAVIIIILCLAAFFWLVSQASPSHAPHEVVTTELPDTYEK